jgi:hypothetical protein
MRTHRIHALETLETKRCLTVSATVTAGGDLRVEGAADGAVEIVAVGANAYQVTDNGVVVADALAGVTDDICIALDDANEGAGNTVTLDLGDQAVDAVYANLGHGANSFAFVAGAAASLAYRGGGGADVVTLGGAIAGRAQLKLGGGNNAVTVSGTVGKLAVDARNGDDAVTIAATATIADNFFARLGGGSNTVTHNGRVDGNFRVLTANADDTVTIADAAVIGGATQLGLGQQREDRGHGRGQCGAGEGETEIAGGLGILKNAGRELGFYFRAAARR